jgi:diadenosine tetraphosphatase ApaH/serine/threonine PP2A family protein phosphatase
LPTAFVKIALLSDLHANRQALEACLAHAQACGAGQYAFLGDLVGYGGEPCAVLDRVMDLAHRGAWVLRGNHDEAALAPDANAHVAQHGAAWAHAQLSEAHKQFLARLPLVIRHDFLLLVHASAHEPARWLYVDDGRAAAASLKAAGTGGATHVFGGHVHEQRLFFQGATVGSVGQPRDGRPDAMYALFDTASMQLTFMRAGYDIEAAAQAIRRAGLPPLNAQRLAMGQ